MNFNLDEKFVISTDEKVRRGSLTELEALIASGKASIDNLESVPEYLRKALESHSLNQDSAAQEKMVQAAQNLASLKPTELSIDQVPQEKQKAVMEFLTRANNKLSKPAPSPVPTVPVPPSPAPEQQAPAKREMAMMGSFNYSRGKLTGDGVDLMRDAGILPKEEESAEPQKPDEAKKSEEAKADDRVHICPNCNWNERQPIVEVTNQEKDGWRRLLVGGKRFVRVHKVFGGSMEITFRTRTFKEDQIIQREIQRQITSGELPSFPVHEAAAVQFLTASKMQLVASLKHMTGLDKDLPCITDVRFNDLHDLPDRDNTATGADLLKIHDAMFMDISGMLYQVILREFTTFEGLCVRLAGAAASPDFWKGIDEAR